MKIVDIYENESQADKLFFASHILFFFSQFKSIIGK